MSYMYSKRFMVFSQVYGQLIIFILAIVNTYYPQYLTYTFVIFILSMFIMMYFTLRTSLKHVVGSEAKDIRSGRKILEVSPEDVMSVVQHDLRLNEELKPMVKSSLLSLANMVLLLLWYYLYFNVVIHYFEGGELIIKFIGFLLGYEIPYIAVTLLNIFMRRSSKVMIQVIRSYTIYDRGIVGAGIAVKFPIPKEFTVNVDPARKFVELVKNDKDVVIKYRLYSKNYDRIADLISRYGRPKSDVK